MTALRHSIFYFAFGVAVTVIFAAIGFYGVNQHWKVSACQHYAARYEVEDGKLAWTWLDDYYVRQLEKRELHATPSPVRLDKL